MRTDKQQNSIKRGLKISNLTLKVRHQNSDIVEKDINCNSDYILKSMKRFGKAIQKKCIGYQQQK